MKMSLFLTASVTALAVAVPSLAFAQSAQSSAEPVSEVTEVVVTGSRLIRNGNDAPTPITVVSVEELTATKPTSVFENLADLPMFSGSMGVTNAPTNNTPDRNSSVSALNLRNLGGLRTLALLDGRRVPPTSALGFVDINSLPTMLLERVDVVTGGASAVYGSDAVTGVVNFVVNKRFEGLSIDASAGISEYGDAITGNFGVAGGTKLFEGRGHIMGSYQHRYDDGIPHQNDRPWTQDRWTLQGTGAANNPYRLVPGANIAFVTFGGYITCPTNGLFLPSQCPGLPLVGYTFDQNGVLSPFERGSGGLTNNTMEVGGDGAYQTWGSIRSESEQDQAFLRFSYDFSDNLRGFASLSTTENFVQGHPTNLRFFGQGVRINACNAFLAQQYRTQLGCTDPNAANPPTFMFNKVWNYELNQFALGAIMSTTTESRNFTGGLEGNFGNGWRWDAVYTHAESELRQDIKRNQNLMHTYAALDAVVNPSNGQVVCRVTLTHPNLYPGCVPINVFGPSAESQEAMNYIFQPVHHISSFEQDNVAASVAGTLFNNWAGPVDVALSAEWRKQTFSLISTSTPSMLQDCTGLRLASAGGNCNPTAAMNTNAIAGRTLVSQDVREIAIEANVPLLRDVAFAKKLDLNLAARYAEYDNDPGSDPILVARQFDATTWKVGATWDVTDDITVRVARSRDIRAPNLWDLYSPVSVTSSFTTDYLRNVQGNVPQQSGGNPFLTPEVGDTLTMGIVWRATPDLSFAIDAYDIEIQDALGTLSGQTQAVQETCYASGGSSPLCGLLDREQNYTSNSPANTLTRVYNRQVNIASQRTRGVDFEANWKLQLFGRDLRLRGLVTHQPELIYEMPPLATIDQAGVSYTPTFNLLPSPEWKVVGFLTYDVTDNFRFDLSQRWRSELAWSGNPADSTVGGIDSVAYTNVTFTYNLKTESAGRYALFLNIQNLFNTDPPPSGTPGLFNQPGFPTNGFAVGDDVLGRYYTVGLRARF